MAPLQVLESFSRMDHSGPVGLNIARFLRDAIIRNQLQPGQTLPEAELAQIMGVSRQPVRDALIRLSESGLLRILPQRGTLVTRISVRAVEGGRFVRQAVERAIIRQAASAVADADLRAMRRNVDEQEEALERGDHAGFLALDDALHQGFARCMGQETAWDALAEVKLQMDRVRFLSVPTHATPGPVLLRQHRAILAGLAARDPDAAEAAMAEHLSEVLSSLPQLATRFPSHFDAT
ncbi:hypothetical protein BKE38_00140 [Pseudoroseomonas deserti]|uniref:HTH gntR-type domain-containing protein n=1 Tax=Teichococcus deserti TaxID=1817963 RepID=A0A1V2H9C6_9PROT|nr:GntR family transcriptional regulator [Pseudoroseomonas deserti]ONG59124.1 hypothetical protein BKE38_00140 [Pseudoroseomonas deserti]